MSYPAWSFPPCVYDFLPHPCLSLDPSPHFLVREVTEPDIESDLVLPDLPVDNRAAHLFELEPVQRLERLVRSRDGVGDSLGNGVVGDADNLSDDVGFVLHTRSSFRIEVSIPYLLRCSPPALWEKVEAKAYSLRAFSSSSLEVVNTSLSVLKSPLSATTSLTQTLSHEERRTSLASGRSQSNSL